MKGQGRIYTGARLPAPLRVELDARVDRGEAASLTELLILLIRYGLAHMPAGWRP